MKHGPWQRPDYEGKDYPGLACWDGRQSGSITVDDSRLPLWSFVSIAVADGWDAAEFWYEPTKHYGYTAKDLGSFLTYLLEARGEFGRLLLVLADAQRCEYASPRRTHWWATNRHRKRVGDQLRRCLAVLEAET